MLFFVRRTHYFKKVNIWHYIFLRFTWIKQKFTQIVLKAWTFFCISPYYLPRIKISKKVYTENLNKQIWPTKAVFWTMDFRTICAIVFCSGKVHILWEGHKIFTQSPNFIWKCLCSSVKKSFKTSSYFCGLLRIY